MLARVSKIMEQLVHAWDVLATMTPPEYSAIRPYLSNSSGFQSAQYRRIEFMLGNKNAAMLKPHAHRPDLLAEVQEAFERPRCTTRPCACWPGAASRCPMSNGARLDAAAHRRRRRQGRLAGRSTATRPSTGISTSSARNWSIWKTPSASGVFGMSRRSSGSSVSSAAPAAPTASAICARCWMWCCFPSCGRCEQSSREGLHKAQSVALRAI